MNGQGEPLVLHADVDAVPWDEAVDVVVAGSGAAGWAAALSARAAGAEVLLLEKATAFGGTTARAGGGGAGTWLWICDNSFLGADGVRDPRDAALRYLARLARPELYDPHAPQCGLPGSEFGLLEMFYDRGKHAVAGLAELDALPLAPLPGVWDYYADLPENRCPQGRTLHLPLPGGAQGTGADIVAHLRAAAERLGVRVRTAAPVRGVVQDRDSGDVLGVLSGSRAGNGRLTRTPGGVVFATGGFARNRELVRTFLRGPLLGSCSGAGSTGDFLEISGALGARLGAMNEAWFTPIVLDQHLDPPSGVFRLPGDSMVVVDTRGERVVNEKATYNEMTRAFFRWDEHAARYDRIPLIMLYDGSVGQRCRTMPGDAAVTDGGGNPLPAEPGTGHELVGATWAELAELIAQRLRRFGDVLPGVGLDPAFLPTLERTLAQFAADAATGVDTRFGRGGTRTERARSGPARRPGMPNPTMHALSDRGPYHAVLLAPGALDTKGGPVIDTDARVQRVEGGPIAGLYGAGNCIASPAGQGYWGGGTTLGLAVTTGWVAGQDAARRAARDRISDRGAA